MDPTVEINERVDVIPVFYSKGEYYALCRPRRMRWRGVWIEFIEHGLLHPTVQGKRMIHVFHESDGVNSYRIEFDAENLTWTLISLIPGGYEYDQLPPE